MKYYVIPDIHGHNDLLQMALAAIYKQNPNRGSRVIFLGDYIDRGPDNLGVIKTVMNPPEGWEFITLKGNHEDMFYGAYMREYSYYYDNNVVDEIRNSDWASVPMIAEWCRDLPLFYREGNNIFAHAWYNKTLSESDQNPTEVLWSRFSDEVSFDDTLFLTHGHTPRRHGPVFAQGRLNLDCGAFKTDRLVIAEFQEGKTGPVGFQEFTAPSSNR